MRVLIALIGILIYFPAFAASTLLSSLVSCHPLLGNDTLDSESIVRYPSTTYTYRLLIIADHLEEISTMVGVFNIQHTVTTGFIVELLTGVSDDHLRYFSSVTNNPLKHKIDAIHNYQRCSMGFWEDWMEDVSQAIDCG